jgi:molecular chaperone HscB
MHINRPVNVCASLDTLRFLRSVIASQSQTPARSPQPCCSDNFRNTLPSQFGHRAVSRSRRPFSSSASPYSKESISKSHYDFFPNTLPSGPPPDGPFSLNLRQLRNEFLQLQAKAHPDRHAGSSKAAADALSSRINEAYKTLQSPLLRAQYLLSLRGDTTHEDDSAKLGEEDEDQELLMEVLELREQIEAAESEAEIANLRGENGVRMDESVKVLEEAFAKDDLATARKEAVRLRYWVNVEDTLHAWEKGEGVPSLQH